VTAVAVSIIRTSAITSTDCVVARFRVEELTVQLFIVSGLEQDGGTLYGFESRRRDAEAITPGQEELNDPIALGIVTVLLPDVWCHRRS